MEKTAVTRYEFTLRGTNPKDEITFTLDGGDVDMGAYGNHSAESIERIAAALAEHRMTKDFDGRSVCPDHGYYKASESASGYKCPTCDPKPVAAPRELVDGEHNGVPL